MKRLLFVDDQPEILRATRRMLMCASDDWDMEFASNGLEALEKLARAPFDVVISDMKMPGMNGAQLLNEISSQHPEVIRIVLSGYAEHDLVFKTIGHAHQYLSKPISSDSLVDTLTRALHLREILNHEGLRGMVSSLETLPTLPQAYHDLMDALYAPDASLNKVGEAIAKDIGMSAKVMQIVNSAFFGLPTHVSDPIHAVNLLGIEIIRSLVISAHVFSTFEQDENDTFSLENFNSHSLLVGSMARAIAEYQQVGQTEADEAFIAGMMHDIGKLIIAANLPMNYESNSQFAATHGYALYNSELELLHTTHAEIGAYLLGLWGFRDNIVEAVAYHHKPMDCLEKKFCPLTAVHVADAFENHFSSENESLVHPGVNLAYLLEIGADSQLETWKKICEKTQQKVVNYDNESPVC